jgi:hypothetical protein
VAVRTKKGRENPAFLQTTGTFTGRAPELVQQAQARVRQAPPGYLPAAAVLWVVVSSVVSLQAAAPRRAIADAEAKISFLIPFLLEQTPRSPLIMRFAPKRCVTSTVETK